MEPVPPYLLVYFPRIRKHAWEVHYLEGRLKDMGSPERAVYEVSMLRELRNLGLIALSEKEDEVVFNPHVREVSPGTFVHSAGAQHTIPVPRVFTVLARGRYVWTELLTRFMSWLLTALVCGFAGGLAFDAKGKHFDTWVVAIVLCVLLACSVSIGLVRTSPDSKR